MDTLSGLDKANKQTQDVMQSGWGQLNLIPLTFLLVLLFVAYLALRLLTPADGMRLQPGQPAWQANGIVLTAIEAQTTGLQTGDVVIAVAGQPLEAWARALFRLDVARPSWQLDQPIAYTLIRNGQTLDVRVTLKPYPLWVVASQNWGTIVFALSYMLVASYVFMRRPQHRAARVMFLSAASILSATTWSIGLHISDIVGGLGFWLYKATSLGAYTLFWISNLHFTLIFPRPLPSVKKFPRLIPAIYIWPYVWAMAYLGLSYAGASSWMAWLSQWPRAENIAAAFLLALSLVAISWQYRLNATGASRQQMRWLMLGTILAGSFGFVLYILPGALGLEQIDSNLMGLFILLYPLSVAIAILRHNLFDIDTLLNRALVYSALSLTTVSLYIFLVGYIGNFFQSQSRSLIAFLATGLVAILFQPLREYLQRGVNRLMYGERDDPVAVLSKLGESLEATIAPEAILPTLVETVAQTLKLPYVALEQNRGNQLEVLAAFGLPSAKLERLPLVYQAETIAYLVVAPRSAAETLDLADMQVLENIAHQAGAAVHAVQLTADLRQSRQALITAREEERRRLRRDLHDGLGPHLASQILTIEAIIKILKQTPDEAEALLGDLKEQSQDAVSDIRRLVHDLRPPALDDLGLVAALHESIRHYESQGLQLVIEAPPLPALPAAVEVAAYRIAQEALTNIIRHAQAQTCQLRFSLVNQPSGPALQLDIQDDGRGLPANYRAGVGCHSMRERAQELGGQFSISVPAGGGTLVSAHFPL